MASSNLYLDKKPNRQQQPIFLYFRYNKSKRLVKYNTGLRIEEKYWDNKKQQAKRTNKFPQYPEFNQSLSNIINLVENIYRSYKNDKTIPTTKQIKQELDKQLKGITNSNDLDIAQNISLNDFIEKFIEEAKQNKKPATIKTYHTTFKHFKAFQKSQKTSYDFNDIDMEFYTKFIKFLTTSKKLSTNAVGKSIQILKVFLHDATDRGINTNLIFKSRKFKVLKEPSQSIYLTETELQILLRLDLSENNRLEKIRDLFLVGCYTGLRFSDFSQIEPANISGNKINIITQKTGTPVSIPLHPIVRDILKKYENHLPRSISNQKMNNYLKELGEMAGINEEVIHTITKAGKKQKTVLPKYQLITTHTARRSFATNAYLADIPTISIMKITGHQAEKSFLKYIKISQEQNADKLASHPFFNSSHLKAV